MTHAKNDAPTDSGLCGSCRYRRPLRSAKATTYVMCERSVSETGYPKYPSLPVLLCNGYQKTLADAA